MSLYDLYCELIELPPSERTQRVEELALSDADRARLLSMLETSDSPELLTLPVEQLVAAFRGAELSPQDLIGRTVGTFRITQFIGEGGSSFVFRAVRPAGDGEQVAAMKVLRDGGARHHEARGFRREQAILAQLGHPNIARLIEAGIDAGGLTYLAMEHVDGRPITAAADALALDLHGRLELYLQLCAAVIAAHAALIVHCDLKPSNVIVDASGHVRVLDFGIAQLLEPGEPRERVDSIALTPEYAAPEQFRGVAPTAAFDIFALGLILAELLSGVRVGRTPGVFASQRVADLDAHRIPKGLPAPRKLAGLLRGDLDSIIATATAEDPAHRYASVAQLAQDIRSHLACQPISVREHKLGYRLGKFMRRYRTGIVVTSLLFLALLVSLAAAAWQAVLATRAASEARAQTARANTLRDIVFDVISESEPGTARSGPITLEDAIEHAIGNLSTRALEPRVRMEVTTRFAGALGRQGKPERALAVLTPLADEARRTFGNDDPLVLEISERLAYYLADIGRYPQARSQIDQALAHADAADANLRSRLLARSSVVGWRTQDPERAMRDGRAAVELARTSNDPELLRSTLTSYSAALLGIGEVQEAASVLEEQVQLAITRYGRTHKDVAGALSGLSRAYRRLGDLDRAESTLRQALEIDRSVFPEAHPFVANHYNALAMVLIARRDFGEALIAAGKQFEITSRTLGLDHTDTINGRYTIGMVHLHQERFAEALPHLREALERYTANFGAADARSHFAEIGYGYALAMHGEYRQGAALLERAIAGLTALKYAQSDFIARALEFRIRAALHTGDVPAAASSLTRLDAARQSMPTTEAELWPGRIGVLIGATRLAEGRNRDARVALEQASTQVVGDRDQVFVAECQLLLAASHLAGGDRASAARTLADSEPMLQRLPWPPRRLRELAQSLRHELQ